MIRFKHRYAQIKNKEEPAIYAILSLLNNSAFALISPIYVLFLSNAGLNAKEITAVSTMFMLSVFFLEIPTGTIADAYGRKVSTVVGWLFRSLSFFLYYFAGSFPVFLFAEFIGAIGQACVSGAFTSWLREVTNYKGFLRITSKTETIIRTVAVLINSIAGVVALRYGYRNLFLMGGVLLLTASILGSFLMKSDKPDHRSGDELRGAEKLLGVLKKSGKFLWNSKPLKLILLSEFIISVSLESVKMFWAIRFAKDLGTEVLSGPISAGISASLILGAWLAQIIGKARKKIIRRLQNLVWVMSIAILISALFDNLVVGIVFFLIHQIARSIQKLVQEAFVQEYLSTEVRASLSSVKSMCQTIGSTIGLTLAGILVDAFSIKLAWIVSSLLISVTIIVYQKLHVVTGRTSTGSVTTTCHYVE